MRGGMGRYRKYFDNCPQIAFKPAPPEALQRFQSDDTDVSWSLQLDEPDQQPAPETQFAPDLEPYDIASEAEQTPQVQSAAEEKTPADPVPATPQPQAEAVEEGDDFEEESNTWLY